MPSKTRMQLAVCFALLFTAACNERPAPFAPEDRSPKADRDAPFDPQRTYPEWAYDSEKYMRPAEELKPEPRVRPDDPLHYFTNKKLVQIPQPPDYTPEETPRVAVWWTDDNGFHWNKAGYFGRQQSHFPFEVSEDGDYGVRFVGPGQSAAEQAPPAPERVYHVDTVKPEVEVRIKPEQSWYKVGDTVTVSWLATDQHLIEYPVRVAVFGDFAAGERDLIELQRDLADEGSTTYQIPPNALDHELRFRVDALDRAGNLGTAVSYALQVVDKGALPPAEQPDPAKTSAQRPQRIEREPIALTVEDQPAGTSMESGASVSPPPALPPVESQSQSPTPPAVESISSLPPLPPRESMSSLPPLPPRERAGVRVVDADSAVDPSEDAGAAQPLAARSLPAGGDELLNWEGPFFASSSNVLANRAVTATEDRAEAVNDTIVDLKTVDTTPAEPPTPAVIAAPAPEEAQTPPPAEEPTATGLEVAPPIDEPADQDSSPPKDAATDPRPPIYDEEPGAAERMAEGDTTAVSSAGADSAKTDEGATVQRSLSPLGQLVAVVDVTRGNGLLVPLPATVQPEAQAAVWASGHPWRMLGPVLPRPLDCVWALPRPRFSLDLYRGIEGRFLADHPFLRPAGEPAQTDQAFAGVVNQQDGPPSPNDQ